MELQDKKLIVARNFFNDNPSEYESFEEALKDQGEVSERFLDFALKPYLKERKEGAHLLMSPGGHIANVFPHGYFEPITEMTEEDGELIRDMFQEGVRALGGKPKALEVLKCMGWKEL